MKREIKMQKKKLLFVCLGNICRSPLAHAVFESKVKEKGLEDYFEIESCGIGDWHVGEMPDERMVAEAKKHGIVMDHPGRTLQETDPEYFDLILPMDAANKKALLSRATEEQAEKIQLFRTFDPESEDEFAEVPDPYYGGPEGFTHVYEIVDRTCDVLLEYLMN